MWYILIRTNRREVAAGFPKENLNVPIFISIDKQKMEHLAKVNSTAKDEYKVVGIKAPL